MEYLNSKDQNKYKSFYSKIWFIYETISNYTSVNIY